MTVEIPVTEAVKQYLHLNKHIKQPLQVSHADPVGIALSGLLMPKRTMRPLNYNKATVVHFRISLNKQHAHKMWLPLHRVKLFNRMVDDLMWMECMTGIERVIKFAKKKDLKAKIDEELREFEQKYNLNHTKMAFETLKKRFYRSPLSAEIMN